MIKSKDRFGAMLALVCAAATIRAQEPRSAIFTSDSGQTIQFMAGMPEAGPVVRGAPYSGESVTTVTQTLADGTRIERTTTTRVFRDGEGRVRREQTVQGLGPLNASGETSVVTILDPVANVSYSLDPNRRTARKFDIRVENLAEKIARTPGGAPPPAPAPSPRGFDPLAPPPPPPPPGPGARGRGPAPEGRVPNAPQPLGSRQIDGLEAVGTKRVEVIPAGRIGNDRPIEIVDERWESPALKVLVQSRHSDPRTGVVEYRLTNVSRAEPSHDLFVVPPDYTIVQTRNENNRR